MKGSIHKNKFTAKQFNELFPDDNACLDYMFEQAYGNMEACHHCGVIEPKYYRIRNKKVYSYKDCGYQISPLAGTIFHKSSTSPRDWFYVVYLFSVSKNGVSAKEIERHTGVTYKTAWRMAKQVRALMLQGDKPLSDVAETDETYVGGRNKGKGSHFAHKEVVFGMVERGIVHTNTIEGFWSQLKRSVDGTHHCISAKHLQLYLNEFVYRYNHRQLPSISPVLIASAARRVQ